MRVWATYKSTERICRIPQGYQPPLSFQPLDRSHRVFVYISQPLQFVVQNLLKSEIEQLPPTTAPSVQLAPNGMCTCTHIFDDGYCGQILLFLFYFLILILLTSLKVQ